MIPGCLHMQHPQLHLYGIWPHFWQGLCLLLAGQLLWAFLPSLTPSLLLSTSLLQPHASPGAESPLLSWVVIIFLLVTMKSFLWLNFNLSRLIFSFAEILLVCGMSASPPLNLFLNYFSFFSFFFPPPKSLFFKWHLPTLVWFKTFYPTHCLLLNYIASKTTGISRH